MSVSDVSHENMRTYPEKDKEEEEQKRRSKNWDRVRQCHSVEEKASYWRETTLVRAPEKRKKITKVDSGKYESAFPNVGGAISLLPDDKGYIFMIDVRLRTKFFSLLNVDEHDNTFEAILEVTLEFEIDTEQYDVCTDFWENKFRPHLAFENSVEASEKPEPIFDEHSEPVENGTLMLCDDRNGKRKFKRHFEYIRRTQRKFRQPLDLISFPFDVQTLPIRFYSNRTWVYGRPFALRLQHPQASDDFNCNDRAEGAHVFERNADCVDDMETQTIFALRGPELLPEMKIMPKAGTPDALLRPQQDEYAILIFVSRQYKSTIFNVHIPLFFMYLLSFLAFFIPPCAVVDRASVSLTLLLTTVALKTYMSDKLPSVPYCSAAEMFLLCITSCLLIQSLLMAAAASSCVRFGAAGQFGFDLSGLDSFKYGEYDIVNEDGDAEVVSDWNCRTEENNFDFWCVNRRARIQAKLDITSIWLTILIGFFTVIYHIFWKIYKMDSQLYEIHKNKFDTETHYKQDEITEPRRKKRCQSFLCFLADRYGVWEIYCALCWFHNKVFCHHKVSYDEAEGHKEQCNAHSSTDKMLPEKERLIKDYMNKRKRAIAFFCNMNTKRAIGYDNELHVHGYRCPPWINGMREELSAHRPGRLSCPTLMAHVKTESLVNKASAHPEATDSKRTQEECKCPETSRTNKMILIDCGTGETKALVASYVKLTSDSTLGNQRGWISIEDKEKNDPNTVGSFRMTCDASKGPKSKKIEMPNFCLRGETQSFIYWLESHATPKFHYEINSAREIDENSMSVEDLASIFGFTTYKVNDCSPDKPLFEIGEVINGDKRSSPIQSKYIEAITKDNIRLLSPRKGISIKAVNGHRYHPDIALQCVLRAARLSRNFRNPKKHDRVEALTTLYFRALPRNDKRNCYLGDAVLVNDFHVSDESSCGLVKPGQKGTVVQANRESNSNSTLYYVNWDHEPSLGATMLTQRHYIKTDSNSDALRGAYIKPISEVCLECITHAEPNFVTHEWQEPQVVVGTGAWFRKSRDKTLTNASDMFKEIERRHPTWKIERNTEFDEAWYEDLSVRYIHHYHNKDDICHLPDALLAVGNGSTQYSSIVAPDIRDRVVFKNNPKKEAVIIGRDWSSKHLTYDYKLLTDDGILHDAQAKDLITMSILSDPCGGEPEFNQDKVPYLVAYGNRFGKSFFEGRRYNPGKVGEQLKDTRNLWYRKAVNILTEEIKQSKICKGTPSYVCCISACYYAATFAGCKTNPSTVTVAEVKQCYEKTLTDLFDLADRAAKTFLAEELTGKEIMEQVVKDMNSSDDPAAKRFKKLDEVWSIELSNLTYQVALMDCLFDNSTVLRICRDWDIGDPRCKHKFRTTWSSGYYLNWLRGQSDIDDENVLIA